MILLFLVGGALVGCQDVSSDGMGFQTDTAPQPAFPGVPGEDVAHSQGGAQDTAPVGTPEDSTATALDETPVEIESEAWVYSCTPIGQSVGDGFFSLEAFDGHLYAGQFGYGLHSQSMLYRYPEWTLTSPGLKGIGESICAMVEFEGHLYANTEDSGDIFRSLDGTNWVQIHDGDSGSIGCGLEVFQGDLYAINYRNQVEDHGRILRWDNGAFTTVYDSGSERLYLREIVAYDGTLYAFATLNKEQGQMLRSSDGTNWTLEPTPTRFFRGHVSGGFLWLSSTDLQSQGVAGVFRFNGSEFAQTYAAPEHYVTDIVDLNGRLFAGTSSGWKDASGPSRVISSPDGFTDWETVCEFPEAAAWDLAVFDGQVYVGTWAFGVGGTVYRVDIDVVSGDAPPGPETGPDSTVSWLDCAPIAQANSAWEVCESGPGTCAGVYGDGAGCAAFCAAAGLVCSARFGGEPGCQKEPGNILDCEAENGHASDWCECGPPPPGQTVLPPQPPAPAAVSCASIEQANPSWEVCETGPDSCAGVYADGAGCEAFCGAAGLVCVGRYGGEPGCAKEPDKPWACDAVNGHASDWCECGVPPGGVGAVPPPPVGGPAGDGGLGCPTDPAQSQVTREMNHHQGAYTKRHNWALTCYGTYGYTAAGAEHQECDDQYFPDGSRTGKAIFTFEGVAPGLYSVFVGGRHTENRNPAGARFIVDGHVKVINQKNPGGAYVWDHHGDWCLGGTVTAELDSTVNSGSDSVMGIRLVPKP